MAGAVMAGAADVSIPDLVLYAVVVLSPVAVFWLIRIGPRVVGWFVRRFRPPRVAASGPPIERLAADLRRVHRALRQLSSGTTIVRWLATRQAYDTLLMQACAAVGVGHRLDQLPEGFDRDMERLRVEEALRAAGLAVP